MIIDQIKANFHEAEDLLNRFISDPENWNKIEAAGNLMVQALNSGNKIISCGNGGSLCDAMHFAEELTGRFHKNRRPLPAIAISDPSHLTCVANDFGYDYIFSRVVEALGKSGDLLLAISTSGNSQNILKAVDKAHNKKMFVIGFLGGNGGKLKDMADLPIVIPSSNVQRIQEGHITLAHIICELVEAELYS